MSQVIPPGTLYSIHPFDQYSPEQNNLWKQLFLILDQLYVRTGGTTDDTVDLENGVEANANKISWLVANLSNLAQRLEEIDTDQRPHVIPRWYVRDISSDHTAAPDEELNVTLGATITMPAYGRVKVNNVDGSDVVVNFTGQTIFGDTQIIVQNYGSVVFKYQPDSDTWVFE